MIKRQDLVPGVKVRPCGFGGEPREVDYIHAGFVWLKRSDGELTPYTINEILWFFSMVPTCQSKQ